MPAPAPPPAAPTPEPIREPAAVAGEAASTPAEKGSSELRSGNDAPTRAAHLRPTFGTTESAYQVHVYSEPEKLDIRFPCEPGEYIVEAAERAGFELPSSCRNGGCLTCTGKLMAGEADIVEDQYVLEDHQIAAGFRLLCITTPRSDVVFMSHQQEEL